MRTFETIINVNAAAFIVKKPKPLYVYVYIYIYRHGGYVNAVWPPGTVTRNNIIQGRQGPLLLTTYERVG